MQRVNNSFFRQVITTIPAIKQPVKNFFKQFIPVISSGYQHTSTFCIQHRTWILGGVAILFALAALRVLAALKNRNDDDDDSLSIVRTSPPKPFVAYIPPPLPRRFNPPQKKPTNTIPYPPKISRGSTSTHSHKPLSKPQVPIAIVSQSPEPLPEEMERFNDEFRMIQKNWNQFVQMAHSICSTDAERTQRDQNMQQILNTLVGQTNNLIIQMTNEGLRIQVARKEQTKGSSLKYMYPDLIPLIERARHISDSLSWANGEIPNDLPLNCTIPSGVINLEKDKNNEDISLYVCYISSVLQLLRVGYKDSVRKLAKEAAVNNVEEDNEVVPTWAQRLAPFVETIAAGEINVSKERILDLAEQLYEQGLTNYEPRKQGCAIQLMQCCMGELGTDVFSTHKVIHRLDRSVYEAKGGDQQRFLSFPVQDNAETKAVNFNDALWFWENNDLVTDKVFEGTIINKLDRLPDVLVISLQRFEASAAQPEAEFDEEYDSFNDLGPLPVKKKQRFSLNAPYDYISEPSDYMNEDEYQNFLLQSENKIDVTDDEFALIDADVKLANAGAQKYSEPIAIPDVWVIPSKHMANAEENGPPPVYQLCGFICHDGKERNSGHYFAYTKDGGVWHRNDDHTITAIDSMALELKRQEHRDTSVIYLYKRLPV